MSLAVSFPNNCSDVILLLRFIPFISCSFLWFLGLEVDTVAVFNVGAVAVFSPLSQLGLVGEIAILTGIGLEF